MVTPATSRRRAELAPPRRRAGALRRERLHEALSRGLDADALLLVAPAGYGKTTLVVEWLAEVDARAAWLSLRDPDRDPLTLVRDLVDALVRAGAPLEGLSERLTQGTTPREAGPLLGEMLERLDALDDLTLLVLADVHVLDGAAEATAVLDELVRGAPSPLRLVLTSRMRPGMPSLPALVAQGRVETFDAADLALDDAEADAILQRAGITDEAARTALRGRAGGWVTALQVLARRYDARAGRVRASGRIELDAFLATEVLGVLPPDDRALLDVCAVFGHIDAQSASELTGRRDAAAALDRLEADTQLLARIDDASNDPPWFRTHALLREHCLSRLATEDPVRLAQLRSAAARLAQQRGDRRQALELALDAEEWTLATALLWDLQEEFFSRGEWTTLVASLDRLPPEVLGQTPALYLARARIPSKLLRPQESLTLLERLEPTGLPEALRVRRLLYLATALRQLRQFPRALAIYREARRGAEETEPEGSLLRIELDLEEGIALGMSGDLPASQRALRRAAAWADEAREVRLGAEAHHNLGTALLQSGELAGAIDAFRNAQRRWDLLAEPEALLGEENSLATALHHAGDLEGAARGFLALIERASALRLVRLVGFGHLGLADIARDRGALAEARAQYERALEVARTIDYGGLEGASMVGLAMVLREEGEFGRARTLLELGARTAEEQGASELASRFHAGLGGLLLSEGRAPEAASHLESVIAQAARGRHSRTQGVALLARAAALAAEARHEDAIALLAELGALVEALGYHQFLVAEARLLRTPLAAPELAAATAFLRHLLAAPAASTAPAATSTDASASTPGALHVRGFGAPMAYHDASEGDLPWRSERSKELFLYLLHLDGAMTREQAEAALWPDVAPERLGSLFHSTMHRLRRAVGTELVRHDREGYRLAADGALVYDVREFEHALARASRAREGSEEWRDALSDATALYTGPFAEGLESEWVEPIRDRLEARYLEAQLVLARHALTNEDFAGAIEHAEAVLVTDPVNEEAVRHLIAAHVGNGHQDLAARAYRRLQEMMTRDLDVQPSAATRRALERAFAGARDRR